jgi:glutamine synthetase
VPSSLRSARILERVAGRFAELNLTPVVAHELEFYLLDEKRDPEGRPLPPSPRAQAYAKPLPRYTDWKISTPIRLSSLRSMTPLRSNASP